MAARVLVPQLLAFGQMTGLEITLLSGPNPLEGATAPTPP